MSHVEELKSKQGGRGQGGPIKPPPARSMKPDVVCLANVTPCVVPYLWPGYLPQGRITVLVGRPGLGKSFLTCDIAARLSVGGEWPDGEKAPLADTLLICAEDDPADTIAPRLAAAGADRNRVHLLEAVTVTGDDGKPNSVAFTLADIEMVAVALDGLPDCKLIVIDPIGSYLGAGTDAHRDNEVRAVLAPLAALAAKRNVAVLLVMHTRKATADFADDTVLGSRAFTAAARVVLHLTEDPNQRGRKLLCPGKTNLTKSPPGLAYRIGDEPARLEWEPEPLDLHADDALASAAGGAERESRRPGGELLSAATAWLAGKLEVGERLQAELESEGKAAGFSKTTLGRAKLELGAEAKKKGFVGKWWWRLPDAATAESAPNITRPECLQGEGGPNTPKTPTKPEGTQTSGDVTAFAGSPECLRGDVSAFAAGGGAGSDGYERFANDDMPDGLRGAA